MRRLLDGEKCGWVEAAWRRAKLDEGLMEKGLMIVQWESNIGRYRVCCT